MGNTKQLILETALDLFNRKGLSEVSLRVIADEMSISQGNLTYHFKLRDDIIVALYYQFANDISRLKIGSVSRDIKELNGILSDRIKTIVKYRFVLSEIANITRDLKGIRENFSELNSIRKQQLEKWIANYISVGAFQPEVYENQHKRVVERLTLLEDSWVVREQLRTRDKSSVIDLNNYHSLVFDYLFPYLTDKGKITFMKEYDLL